jgi:hypothetical protein
LTNYIVIAKSSDNIIAVLYKGGFTMPMQIICHLFGDYVLQSSWMANNKVKRWFPAVVHSLVYYIPFFFLIHPSLLASLVIVGTHAILDRFRIARYIAYANHYLSPPCDWKPWKDCCATGYYKELPPFLAVWLMIIVDNTIHLTINALAIAYL